MRKGSTHLEASKKKMSKARVGMKLSKSHKKNISIAGSGKNNPNYGKGKYTELEAILNGKIVNWWKWREFRKVILERDNYTCQICGNLGNSIHHKKERKDYPELCWNEDNVITICKSCHVNIDGHKNPKGKNQYVK